MKTLKNLLLFLISVLCLSVGIIALVLERQAHFAQIEVKDWTKAQCLLEELKYSVDNFTFKCTYNINGKDYSVKKQTPIWNQYFDMISGNRDVVEIFYIDNDNHKNIFQFRKGQMADFWYEPNNPANSVLMPGAGSLRGFIYFGIGFYVLVFAAGFFGWRKKKKLVRTGGFEPPTT